MQPRSEIKALCETCCVELQRQGRHLRPYDTNGSYFASSEIQVSRRCEECRKERYTLRIAVRDRDAEVSSHERKAVGLSGLIPMPTDYGAY